MKNRSLLIFLSILFLIITNDIKAQSIIPWSKETKLKWSDFKAVPNTDVLAYAQTSYKIEILPSDVLVDENDKIQNYEVLTVVANFYTNHSWVFKKSDYLLTHEQLHFDIAGLYAHKIKIEFEKLKKNKISDFETYSDVYQVLWNECRNIQRKFDKETSHGQLVDKNNVWIKNISEQLNNY